MTVNWRSPVTKPLLPFLAPKPQGDRSTFRVTSPFGYRDDPLNPGKQVFHGGLDIGDFGTGSDVVAAADGTVQAVGFLKEPYSQSTGQWPSGNYGGWMVTLLHGGTQSIYAHMIPNSSNVQVGRTVKAGQPLGLVGESGAATGRPHLHFGIKLAGRDVDPWPLITAEDDMPLPAIRTPFAKGTAAINVRVRKSPSTTAEYYQLKATTVFDVLIPSVEGDRYSLDGGKTFRTDWSMVARNEVGFVARPLLTLTPTPEGTALGGVADCSKQDAKLAQVAQTLPAIRSAVDAVTKLVNG